MIRLLVLATTIVLGAVGLWVAAHLRFRKDYRTAIAATWNDAGEVQ